MRVLTRRKAVLGLVLSGAAIWWPISCSGFSSYKMVGGKVHGAIIESALAQNGLSARSIYQIVAGSDAQDDPSGDNFTRSQCHATENQIPQTFMYIKTTLGKAVDMAGSADRSAEARRTTLYTVGQAFHSLQDFYSHSNYLEFLLMEGRPLKPVSWEYPPAMVRTCYYHYSSFFKQEVFESRKAAVKALRRRYPALEFHTDEEYAARSSKDIPESKVLDYALAPVSFCHMELNKDNEKTLEGSVISAQYGRTYYELAKELAEKDTLLAWLAFERAIRQKYPGRAEMILMSLKSSRGLAGDFFDED